MSKKFDRSQLEELLHQALATELGGQKIYEQALKSAVNEDLRSEWQDYLDETINHQAILREVFSSLGIDASAKSAGADVVTHIGESLVQAMEMARANGNPTAAELVACECVVLAETKDHLNWELIGHVVGHSASKDLSELRHAYEEVEEQEDHHLYHTRGFCRDLWIVSLGFDAVLAPPEVKKNVETAIGAARAEHAREQLM
jgi:hypothetical protein